LALVAELNCYSAWVSFNGQFGCGGVISVAPNSPMIIDPSANSIDTWFPLQCTESVIAL